MSGLRWHPFRPHAAVPRVAGECVAAIGVFDGMHRGHQALVRAARKDADERGVPLVAVTFDPDPAEVVGGPGTSLRLLGTADRVSALYGAGANEVVALRFGTQMADMAPDEFVAGALCAGRRPVAVHVGTNFRFGRHGEGTVADLRLLGERHGFEAFAHELLAEGGDSVSATRIRALLREPGRLREANELLGRCHYVRGHVEHGRGEGTSFGFPTANVVADARDCMPAEGVYACYVVAGGEAWPAAANVGAPPSFSAGQEARPAFLEANLIGFAGDLYGAEVAVSFVEWLRPSRMFDSLEELERVVLGNIDWVRAHLGERAHAVP